MIPSQNGRLAVVTGANSGVGRETAHRLALAGAEVILAVRTPAKGVAAARDIPGATRVEELDLAWLARVSRGGRRGLTTWPWPVGCGTPRWRSPA
jgi:NAD(P)-dependent dehydrogenase (short-subunit alcohol dehydrogenase family)